MEIARTVAYWIFVSCLPVLVITSNICWGVSEIRLYEYGFDKYRISQATGIDELELKRIAQHLIDYFNSKVDSAQVAVVKGGEEFDLFNERELVHLQDVKSLIQLDYWVQRGFLAFIVICGFVLLLWLGSRWWILVRGLFWGSLATLALMVVLALWAIFGFEQLFLLFHLVSFSNEFWILNPAKDYLIMLFPESFFYDVALFGFGAMILEALLVGGIAFGTLRLVGWRNV
ncbi:MAG TPA: TIGR01906 family membrane protein [Dehalococcoidia bacterium]|nr:TIGR01906 family membrane protein [Dehalococcoidia bacterium]